MYKPCSNHVQTRFSLKLTMSDVAQAFPQQCLKPCLIIEIWRCQGLLEAIFTQLRCVQTCVCVNVGRGPSLPETMFKPCLITEIGRCPRPLEAPTPTRTPKPTPTPTPVLTPTPAPTELDFLQCGFRRQRTKELRV